MGRARPPAWCRVIADWGLIHSRCKVLGPGNSHPLNSLAYIVPHCAKNGRLHQSRRSQHRLSTENRDAMVRGRGPGGGGAAASPSQNGGRARRGDLTSGGDRTAPAYAAAVEAPAAGRSSCGLAAGQACGQLVNRGPAPGHPAAHGLGRRPPAPLSHSWPVKDYGIAYVGGPSFDEQTPRRSGWHSSDSVPPSASSL